MQYLNAVLLITTLFCSASAHAIDRVWVSELKAAGFDGLTYNLFVSPLPVKTVFRVTSFPEKLSPTPSWPHLGEAMLTELKQLRSQGVVIAFAHTDGESDAAWAVVRSGEFGGREDLWPGLVLTSRTSLQYLRHEEQHLQDYAKVLHHDLLQDLEVAGFTGSAKTILFFLIWKARAFAHEYASITSDVEKETLTDFYVQRYLNDGLNYLRAQKATIRAAFLKIFLAHTNEFAGNAFLTTIQTLLSATCEDLILPTRTFPRKEN